MADTHRKMPTSGLFRHIALPGLCLALASCGQNLPDGGGQATDAEPARLAMIRGQMADYGATPWYTAMDAGASPLVVALDTGADFIWATSDLCRTAACNAHNKVNTGQPGFQWVDRTPTRRSFGPWGTMTTETGKVSFTPSNGPADDISADIDFFASIDYTGDKFRYLAWDGGIGFPSRSDQVTPGSGFYFQTLLDKQLVPQPRFDVVTALTTDDGLFVLGGDAPEYYDAATGIELKPAASPIKDLWGTELYKVTMGGETLIKDAIFFLDTGSSRFKGDATYVQPVLDELLKQKDAQGNPIFEKIIEDNKWVGLAYIAGGPADYTLPVMSLTIGQTCNNTGGQSAVISLDAMQYSYLVEEGDRKGRWVVAAHILPGVGGLLVGSTFMDLLYTSFRYEVTGSGDLEQSDMYLYRKTQGSAPALLTCTPTP